MSSSPVADSKYIENNHKYHKPDYEWRRLDVAENMEVTNEIPSKNLVFISSIILLLFNCYLTCLIVI